MENSVSFTLKNFLGLCHLHLKHCMVFNKDGSRHPCGDFHCLIPMATDDKYPLMNKEYVFSW
jgi:hypothetical protein